MAESSSPTTDVYSNQIGYDWDGKAAGTNPLFGTIAVTRDFGKTIGWQLAQGRDFSRDYPTDTTALIINEAAVRFMGFKDPIGQPITWLGHPRHIIGVVKDMIVESPYQAIQPFVYYIQTDYARSNVILRLNPNAGVKQSLATIGKDYSDPPADWFIHQRWTNKGTCPRDGLALKTATIGGRTTRWCPHCQRR